MSNLRQNNKELTIKQESNLQGYNNMVMKNYETTFPLPAFDPKSLEEKMK